MSDTTQGRRIDRSSRIVVTLLVVALVAVFGRVAQLQVRPSQALAAHIGDRTSTVVEPGRRGDLLDRRGRVIAASYFGQRVFVDPTRFRSPPDADILTLADALGLPIEKVDEAVRGAMIKNQARAALTAAAAPADADGAATPSPIRYVRLGHVLEDWRIENIRRLKIPGVHLELRGVREPTADDLVASLVGKVGADDTGLMGVEKVVDSRVQPAPGKLEFVRDASGRALWVPPGGYEPAKRGEDVRLALDLNLQLIATEELERGVLEADAQGGRVVMLDPSTGEILAMVDMVREVPDAVPYDWQTIIPRDKPWGGGNNGPRYATIHPDPARAIHPALGRNRCVEDIYEPGSTFKPFMWSAVTELGLATPDETFNTYAGHYTTPYGRHIGDVVKRDYQSWREVLVNSSNIGMVQGTARMHFAQMHDAVLKFGFGKPTGTGLPGESGGLVTLPGKWTKYTQTSVAMGHEVAVTPVQMVRAFSVFARSGDKAGTLPSIRLTALSGEPVPDVEVTKRVLPRQVAELARETMRGVTANLDRKLAARPEPETGWRYELFGKSGTAEIPMGDAPKGKRRPKGSDGYFRGQYNANFIAAGPVEDPRLVMVAIIDDPSPEHVRARTHYGAATAGPVVRRAMERALAYLAVASSLTPVPTSTPAHPDQ
ncbi:MAG: peptidoglycan D,D-transpeptidase FtsI family protein [Phycisphaerales bacterium]